MQQLTGGVYRVQSSRGGNAYIVETENRVVLIDTGLASGADAILGEIRAERLPPVTDVVLTHYDPDHAGAAAAIQRASEARVWLGAADARILRGVELPSTRARRTMMRMNRFGTTEVPELSELPDDEETELAPDLFAVPAPGHTPGHHIVRWRGVLFIGDAARIGNGRLVHFPRLLISDRTQADETLALIAASHPRLVCPGHGSPDRLDAQQPIG